MKQSCLQVAFVGVFLLIAAMIVGHGRPVILSSARAQGAASDGMRPAKPADRTAALASIRSQLNAFQKSDFPTAVRYQSSELQAHFGSVAAFQHMMQTHYPAFLTFKSFSFGPVETADTGQHLLVPVTLVEGNGIKLPALYLMVREGKTYKVDGVQGGMAPEPDPGSRPSQET